MQERHIYLPMSGSLFDWHPMKLLGLSYQQKWAARISLEWSGLSKMFWVHQGNVTFASSTVDGEHPLDFLIVDYGDVILPHYEEKKSIHPKLFYAWLTGELNIPVERVHQSFLDALYLNLSTAMNWIQGTFLVEQAEPFSLAKELDVPIPLILYKLVQHMKLIDYILNDMQDLHKKPVLKPTFFQEAFYLPLQSKEALFLDALSKGETFQHAITLSGLDKERAFLFVYFLKVCGWLHFEEPVEKRGEKDVVSVPVHHIPSEQQPQSGSVSFRLQEYREKVMNFYRNIERLTPQQIFQISRTTTLEDVQRTKEALLREYSLDSCPPELKNELEPFILSIRTTIQKAYFAVEPELKVQRIRKEKKEAEQADQMNLESQGYWKLRGPSMVEHARKKRVRTYSKDEVFKQLYDRGMEYIQIGDNYNAARCFEGILEMKPDFAEGHFLLATVYEAHPRLHNKALEHYMSAHELEPSNTLYLSHLVSLLLKNKLYRKALRYTERWLELEPSNRKVKKILELIKKNMKNEAK